MRKLLLVVAVLALLGVAAVGLWRFSGNDGGSPAALVGKADDPLAFVPADTPYVFANIERMPQATIDAFLQQSEPVLAMWRGQLDTFMALADDNANPRGTRWLRALLTEFEGKTIPQAFAATGMDMQALSAVYGIGVVPVARIALADAAAFRAFVARVEAKAGETLPTGRIDEVDYWQFTGPDDAPLRIILALHDNHAVLTVAPVADDAALRVLLGLQRPAQDLRDGAALVALNRQYGYTPYASGYIDVSRLVTQLTAPATPLETAFLAALKVEKPAVDEVCRNEYAALAALMPRIAFGYTTLEPKRSHAVSHLELRRDVAQDLQTLRAPMPGIAAGSASIANLGVSLKLAAIPALIGKWSSAAKAAPWQCASLADLNQAAEQAAQQAANPALFAAAPVFQGFHAMLSRFEMPVAGEEPDVSGKLLIGSPNPAALVGMARSFAPPLAALKLEPDGELQALPALPGAPAGLVGHVAMTDTLLGLAVGAGEEATLKQAMQIDPAQQPLLVLGYTGAAFTRFLDQMPSSLPGDADAKQREETERSIAMMRQMYALIGRIEMRIELDDEGIAIHQSATMN